MPLRPPRADRDAYKSERLCPHPSRQPYHTRRSRAANAALLALLGRAIRRRAVSNSSCVTLTIAVRHDRFPVHLLGVGHLGITPIVVKDVVRGEAVGDTEDEEEPEQVEGLQRAEQGQGDDEGQGALVLLRLPVELVGADRLELGEKTEEDAQVEVVAQVDPHAHEGEVVGAGQDVVEVVEGFGGLHGASQL